nr:DUF4468 domain-containing protein [uncultured Carboxylicivirga sp.]
MKHVTTILILTIITLSAFSQEMPKLKISKTGVEPIVVETGDLTANQMYEKALNWVKETYENPDKVLKAQIENKKIRVSAFAKYAWWYKAMGIKTTYNMDYSVEISFKDGKYRFEYFVGQFYTQDYTKALFSYSTFFKSNGDVRKSYKDAVPSIELTMNTLAQNFYSYVTGVTEESDDEW